MFGCSNLIATVVLGALFGFIARLLVPGGDTMSWFGVILLGIAGSFLGGFIHSLIDKKPGTEFRKGNFLFSIVGSVVALLIWRMLQK